jgi:hypothetical protein
MHCPVCEHCHADPTTLRYCSYGGPYAGYMYRIGTDTLTGDEVEALYGADAQAMTDDDPATQLR